MLACILAWLDCLLAQLARLLSCFVGWLVDRLVSCLVACLVVWLVGWLVAWLACLLGSLRSQRSNFFPKLACFCFLWLCLLCVRYLVCLICYALPCLARDGCAWRLAEQLSLFILAGLTSHSKRFNLLYLAYLLACLLCFHCVRCLVCLALAGLRRLRLARSLASLTRTMLGSLDLLTLRSAGSLAREARFACMKPT